MSEFSRFVTRGSIWQWLRAVPTINEMFPGRFLRGADLKKPVKVIIREVAQQKMYSPSAQRYTEKWVLHFRNATKGLVLNVTNAKKIAEIAGSENSDDWIGKRIVLYPENVKVMGKITTAVRVRPIEETDNA